MLLPTDYQITDYCVKNRITGSSLLSISGFSAIQSIATRVNLLQSTIPRWYIWCDVDTEEKQVKYLLPKSIELSKGSNTVVNLLYDRLMSDYKNVVELSLHADNCIGQNRNNLVLFFLNFLILTAAFKRIELNFMFKGHIKFSCDWSFGLAKKKKFWKCVCHTLNESVEIFESSTPISKTNIAHSCRWAG